MANRSNVRSPWRADLRLSWLLAFVAVVSGLAIRWFADRDGEPWGWLLPVLLACAAWALGQFLERRLDARLRRLRRLIRRVGHGDFTADAIGLREGEWGNLAAEIVQAAGNLDSMRGHYEEIVADKEREVARLRVELGRVTQDNVHFQAESLQHGKSIASLQEFVVAINRMGDPAQIAGQLLTYLDNEVDYHFATVLLVDPETRKLAPVAMSNREKGTRLVGKYIKDFQSLQPMNNKSAIGRVMEAGKPIMIANVEADRRGLVTRPEIKAELAVPLKVQDKVVGVVHLECNNPDAYTAQQETLLALLANATATAIGNIRLFEEEAKVRMLREMDRVKSHLISTVSHELRTPLASIKGYSTSLQRPQGKLDEHTRQEFLQIIEEEADRLSEMITNLLDMSKIEAGVLRLHKQPVQLERMVRRVVDQAKHRAPQCRFRVRFSAEFPAVPAAHHRVEQVVHNLVENAIKYSPDGGRITISGEVEDTRVVVSVSDEGMGIPPEHLQRIFEPFYQVDSGTTRRVGGSGLGLAICRGFVEAHGGEIWAESEVGQGATFRFGLPFTSDTQSEEMSAIPAANGG